VGALIPRKGQRFVIEALTRLPDALLLLAGQGPDEPALRGLAVQLGVAERVRFLGPVPHAELPIVLNAADVFVLPSASEGLANAWVEALACGTPLVTTPIPGAQELITDPDWGQLVPRDAAAIAAAVQKLLIARPSPERVQEATRGMSWQANAAVLVEHWRRLAAS
jgi:glycosyltransferase involved in cell wall biosynthesis